MRGYNKEEVSRKMKNRDVTEIGKVIFFKEEKNEKINIRENWRKIKQRKFG